MKIKNLQQRGCHTSLVRNNDSRLLSQLLYKLGVCAIILTVALAKPSQEKSLKDLSQKSFKEFSCQPQEKPLNAYHEKFHLPMKLDTKDLFHILEKK